MFAAYNAWNSNAMSRVHLGHLQSACSRQQLSSVHSYQMTGRFLSTGATGCSNRSIRQSAKRYQSISLLLFQCLTLSLYVCLCVCVCFCLSACLSIDPMLISIRLTVCNLRLLMLMMTTQAKTTMVCMIMVR